MSKVKGCAKCGGLVKPGYDCELCDAGFCGDCVYIKKVTEQSEKTWILSFQVGNRHKVVCKPCDDGWLFVFYLNPICCNHTIIWWSLTADSDRLLYFVISFLSFTIPPFESTIASSNNVPVILAKLLNWNLNPNKTLNQRKSVSPKKTKIQHRNHCYMKKHQHYLSVICSSCDQNKLHTQRCKRTIKSIFCFLFLALCHVL